MVTITNVPVPTGGSARQTSGAGGETTSVDGTKRRYGSAVNDERIPFVNGSTAVDERNAKANASTSNIVNTDPPAGTTSYNSQSKNLGPRIPPVAPNPTPVVAKFSKQDQRVRLVVPSFYLTGVCEGPRKESSSPQGVLSQNRGIVFPYTPSITISHSASYDSKNVLHSNYTQYFYKSSSVSSIQITGKFTAQNEYEAQVILAVQNLGRALTKMQYGEDPYAGAPPPVCKLNGYGDYMFNYIPVGVESFSMTYPQDVDYITLSTPNLFGNTSVPVVTEVTIGLVILYSKAEILGSSVNGYINNNDRLRGYL